MSIALGVPLEQLIFDNQSPVEGVPDKGDIYGVFPAETIRTMRLLDALPREVAFHIRQLIAILGPVTDPRYWDEYESQVHGVSKPKPPAPARRKRKTHPSD